MTVSERLRELMQKAGIPSAKQLSVASGVSQTMISKILRGESSPTVSTLEMLCEALRISTTEFFAGVDDERQGDDLWELREEFRRNPDLNMLFSMAKGATREDIIKTVKMLKVMKGDDT